MRSIYLCIFLFFFSCLPYCKGAQKERNVQQYFSEINLAELAIVDSNYPVALQHYKNAFDILPNSFGRDIYNAALLGCIMKDTSFAVTYMNKLAYTGYPCYLLLDDQWTKEKENESFFNYLMVHYDSLSNLGCSSAMAQNGTKLWSFLKKDQKVRKNGSPPAEMATSDSLNMEQLFAFLEQNEFPCYGNMGFFDPG